MTQSLKSRKIKNTIVPTPPTLNLFPFFSLQYFILCIFYLLGITLYTLLLSRYFLKFSL